MCDDDYTYDFENHIYEEIPHCGKLEKGDYINPVYELSTPLHNPNSKRYIYIIVGVVSGLVVIVSLATVLGIMLNGRTNAFESPQGRRNSIWLWIAYGGRLHGSVGACDYSVDYIIWILGCDYTTDWSPTPDYQCIESLLFYTSIKQDADLLIWTTLVN